MMFFEKELLKKLKNIKYIIEAVKFRFFIEFCRFLKKENNNGK
jgi:hypothetical protein